jgi:hypothetical protein
MMVAFALALVALSAQTPVDAPVDAPAKEREAAPHTIFVASFTAVDVQTETADILQSLVTAELARERGVSVLSTRELRATLDEAAASESAACGRESACFAELASALGARHLVLGACTLANGLLSLELSLIDLERGESLSRAVVVARDLSGIHERLQGATQNLLIPLIGGVLVEIPSAEPFRRFDDASSLVAMGALGALTGGTAALFAATGFLSIGAMTALLTSESPLAQIPFFFIALALVGVMPFAASAMGGLVTVVVDLMAGGEQVMWRALLVGALAWPLAALSGGTLWIAFLGGFPLGWLLGLNLGLFDPNDALASYQAQYAGGTATALLAALVVVGPLVAVGSAGLYAFGIWWLEEVEPEGEVLVERLRPLHPLRMAASEFVDSVE